MASPEAAEDRAHNWYRAGWEEGIQFGIIVGALLVLLLERLP